MIYNTHNNVHFLNQINGKIPRNGVIDKNTINPHDLYYQCSKDGPDFLFVKLGIRDCGYEPLFPEKIKLLSFQIKMNTLFKNNIGVKRRK